MTASFCWLCGKPLKTNAAGELISVPHEVEPGRIVLVHKTCERSATKPEPEYINQRLRSDVHRYLGDRKK